MSCRIPQSFVCFCFLMATPANAELTVIEDAEGQQGLTVFRMTVTPAAEPVPALKHRFSVPMHKRKPGNAATHYLRSLGESSPQVSWRRVREKYGDEVDDWYDYDFPMDQIPMEQFRKVARVFEGYVNNHIRSAAERRQCEWGLEEMDLRGLETIEYLLPDAQVSREISRALAVLSRLAIIDRRYEAAIDYIRMNYQLGQDFGKQRFMVCNLVGLAEVGMANKSVIELIGSPHSPNMYWALTELPTPIINMRESINLEMSLGLRIFPELLEAENAEHSPAEWNRLLDVTLRNLRNGGEILGVHRLPKQKLLAELTATALSLVIYPGAKQRLLDSGLPSEPVVRMSVAQVLLVDTAREYQRLADEHEKWWYVNYNQMPQRIGVELEQLKGISGGFGPILANLLLPAVHAARTAQVRTEWQMNAMRTLEALRMHAAETGTFPTSLDDVKIVPVPKNTITEQPYVYRLDGETAVLELPFSDGMPGVAWRFEMRLTKE